MELQSGPGSPCGCPRQGWLCPPNSTVLYIGIISGCSSRTSRHSVGMFWSSGGTVEPREYLSCSCNFKMCPKALL